MLKNYLIAAWRNARRHPLGTTINMLGLAIGVSCFVVIGLYVLDEHSWDRFHPDADRIYRVEQSYEHQNLRWSVTSVEHAPAIERIVPQVESTARLFRRSYVVGHDEDRVDGQTIGFTDPDLFDIFQFDRIHGTGNLLDRPETIVLTQPLSQRLFGSDNPVGRTVILDNEHAFSVTGVVSIPANTHLAGNEAFVPFSHAFELYPWLENNAGASTTNTYVRLREGADVQAASTLMDRVSEEVRGEAGIERLDLMPVRDLRLNPKTTGSSGTQGTVNLFIAIAFLILAIACVNYVNLAVASGVDRLRDIGVRKTFGAYRSQLMAQFLGESLLQAGISVFLGLALVRVSLPYVNRLTDKAMSLEPVLSSGGLAFLLLFGAALGLLAGAYPAIIMSRFKPVSVLSGKGSRSTGGTGLRRTLVVVQFVAAIVLISGTIAIQRQLDFVQAANLGLDDERVVTIDTQTSDNQVVDEFVRRIKQEAVVAEASRYTGSLGRHGWRATMSSVSAAEGESGVSHLFMPVDPDFTTALGIEIIAGRGFSRNRTGDARRAMLINESSARALGFDEPQDAVGERFNVNYVRDGEIVGVVRDFHLNSLRNEIDPVVLVQQEEGMANVAVKLATTDMESALAMIRTEWSDVLPEWPFVYSFVDQQFDALYRAEERTGRLFSWFAWLALIVATMGLFGLATLLTRQRSREISIRKVLGADLGSLIALLTRSYLGMIAVAFVVAAPLTWLVVENWLQEFAYRIAFPYESLLLAGALTLGATLLVVGSRTVRTALADPVVALRSE